MQMTLLGFNIGAAPAPAEPMDMSLGTCNASNQSYRVVSSESYRA
jgi:hypothetical protein